MADIPQQNEDNGAVQPARSAVTALMSTVREAAQRERAINVLLDYGIYLVLLLLIVYFAFASPYFLTIPNLVNVLLAVSITGIVAAGMTISLIAGQLDLTVGAVIGLTTVVTASLVLQHGFSYPLAIATALGVSLLIGVINSFLVVNLGINSIIATLAMSLVIGGFSLVLADGQTIPMTNLDLVHFINLQIFGIPIPVLGLLFAFIGGYVLLMHTKFGWHIYAVGGNPSAASRAAIKVQGIYRFVFLLTALLAGIAGVITAGRTASGSGAYGAGEEFQVLAAILLGGIGLSGGSGNIERSLVGVLIVGIVDNGLVLLNVPSFYQTMASGGIFLLAVVLSAIRQKRLSR